MKVLLFSNLYPTSAEPTRGVFTSQLADELATLCDLTIAVPLPWFPRSALSVRLFPTYAHRFGNLEPVARADNPDVSFPRYPLIPRLSEGAHSWLMELGVRAHIERLHRRVGFDVINAHWLYPDGVAAVRLGERLGIPVVLTALGCDGNEFLQHRNKRRKILEALASAQAVTTVSSALAEVLRGSGVTGSKISVIPNGVDTARFQSKDRCAARVQLALPPDSPLVVCVSRLSEEKGVQFLVEAYAQVRERVPGAILRIVGDGDQRQALTERVAALGLGDSVELVGAVAHSEVATWLNAATVVCIPSVREGHPNVAMEALACGRPIVASRVGALPDFIDARSGLLVPPGDPTSLADALVVALTRNWSADEIASSVREYSWQQAARRYMDVIHTVLASRDGRGRAA